MITQKGLLPALRLPAIPSAAHVSLNSRIARRQQIGQVPGRIISCQVLRAYQHRAVIYTVAMLPRKVTHVSVQQYAVIFSRLSNWSRDLGVLRCWQTVLCSLQTKVKVRQRHRTRKAEEKVQKTPVLTVPLCVTPC